MKNEDIIESIISLIAADGEGNKEEMQFFYAMCQHFNISQPTIDTILAKVRQGKGRIHLPQAETDKRRLLYFLVQTVVADGKVTPTERQILSTVVRKLEMSESRVEEFLQLRLKEVKAAKYSAPDRPQIMCPKCGHEQIKGYRCRRCGIIFDKYQVGEEPDDAEQLMRMLSGYNKLKQKPS